MTARTYIDVLRDNLPQSAIKLGISNSYYFQQDNDPQAHCRYNTYVVALSCTQKTCHSTPITRRKSFGKFVDLKIRKRKISSKSALKQALIEEWSNTDAIVTENLIKSMPARLQAVIDAKGMYTKY
ncbi:tc1-like transposase protein [Trichonephila inaurata madagascariensis]|uniref:Tc1-like transposase protein n=1 Tax=Trichonephila inaurata madagascariensis TaxID=2747483 RepID=A0A8X6X3X8_9ARAC|nr:tc1-like transposase protein [Trichonephila inaurata madagascariensis]